MFEVYRHEFELKGVKYSILPVSGEHLGLFYSLMNSLKGSDAQNFNLDAEATAKLYSFTLEVFKKSYPKEPIENLQEFVSQNLLMLIEPIVAVTIPQKE